MTSNYFDSGFTFTDSGSGVGSQSGTAYPSATQSSVDIYTVANQVGIYMINGKFDSAPGCYPVFGSMTFGSASPVPSDADDAYLVYPGFGFILYYDNFSGTRSRLYYNTTNIPIVFATNSWGDQTHKIYTSNSTSNVYGANQTNSIKVFFRGVEQVGTGWYTVLRNKV